MGRKKSFIGNWRSRHLAWDVVGRPALRMTIVILLSFVWFYASIVVFLTFLPQFGFYTTLRNNIGTNDTDLYLFFTWVPEVSIYIIGILWAGGIFGMMEQWWEKSA